MRARLPLLLAWLWLLPSAALLAPLALASDDWCHLSLVGGFASVWEVFDPELVPLRPGQWLWFYCFVSPEALALSRLPGILLAALGLWLVYALARALGRSQLEAGLAALLFALYPNLNAIAWPAAVGWPGRHLGILLGLLAYVHHLRRPRLVTHAGVLSGLLLALFFHQIGVLLVAFCAAYAWVEEGRSAWSRRSRDPLTWILAGVLAAYLCYLILLKPERSAGGAPLASLLTGVFRAILVLWPTGLRHYLEDCFKAGGLGLLPVVLGMGSTLAIALLAFWRGGISRFVVLAAGIELAFSTLAAGFLARYAITASAFWAIGLAGLWTLRRRLLGQGLLALLALGYGYESLRMLRDFQAADAAMAEIRSAVRAADRAAAPGRRLVLLDIPAEFDRDRSVPMFRYGLPEALRHWGVRRPVELWSQKLKRGPVSGRRVSAAEVAAAVAAPDRLVLRYDPAGQRLESLGGSGR